MIDKTLLQQTVEQAVEGSDIFIVSVDVTADNVITVTIGSPSGVDLDRCVDITHRIESVFDRDVEDYELEVGSAGITSPLRVLPQFMMNIGKDVEVLTRDGRKLRGILSAVDPGLTAITVDVPTKVREPGEKRPKTVNIPTPLEMTNVKTVTPMLNF